MPFMQDVCPKSRRIAECLLVVVLCNVGLKLPAAAQPAPQEQNAAVSSSVPGKMEGRKRPFTEEDAIRMDRIAGHGAINEYAGTLTKDFAYFSPDKKQFAIILSKGNLETNTNDYSLLVFRTTEVFHSSKPRVLAFMPSSSNREGITDPVWLSDNDTILFLGQHPGETMQLYSVRSSSGMIRKLTNHAANVVAFSSDLPGERIVCAAEKSSSPIVTPKSLREGVTVAKEDMTELLAGERRSRSLELLLVDTRKGSSRSLPVEDELQGLFRGYVSDFALSPDGRQLVAKMNLTEVPDGWREYQDPVIARLLNQRLPKGSVSWIYRYGLIDLETGRGRVLLDAPISYRGSEVLWSPDARSVILAGVFLPLRDSHGKPELLAHPSVVEVDAMSLEYTKIGDEDLRLLRWDHEKNLLKFETRPIRATGKAAESRDFRKGANGWELVLGTPEKDSQLQITAEQDLSTPPKIVASDPATGRKSILLDLGLPLKEIELGHVEEITFVGAGHLEVHAGLYFPPGYESQKKYPLVIQTHGFDPKGFWIDGSFTTAFAAQALASHGMLVLQIPDRHDWDGTPDEAPKMMETFERAVDYVDGLGILDRDRLGVVGFSRTGLYAYYLLTHSKLHFQAAVVADGSDGSYSQYLQFLNAYSATAADSESLNGGMPFGPGLLYWLRRSPEFLLDTVSTALMTQAASRDSLSSQWAEFIGLRRLGKPAELMYFPTGTHILQKPWDRLASQQGTVDWLVFWLKGEEDNDPAKAEKYARWREMRAAALDRVAQSK